MASFPGSSPALCRIPYGMPQKAGEELGNELIQSYNSYGIANVLA